MIAKGALRVCVVHSHQSDRLVSLISDTLKYFGCETMNSLYDARLPEDLDVVFVCGPYGKLVPLVKQVLAYPLSRRPVFVLWMIEQLPNPNIPEWVRRSFGEIRSYIERIAFRERAAGEWRLAAPLRWLMTKAHRFRYYGDLCWLRREGILSVLAVTSQWTADFLRARGFDPTVAYLGSHPDWGADLRLERDIPILWMGKIATGRRKHLLEHLRAELKERGLEILMIDGVENPYVFGEKRTILLNRTKIVLNLLREKWDDNSMRYYLAAPNRALIITEPTLPHTPFLADVHLVEAQIDQITDTICYYLSHEEERTRIADQAYALVRTDLTMRKAVHQILDQVLTARQNAMSKYEG